jgi:UDP-glucose 4-epimerase
MNINVFGSTGFIGSKFCSLYQNDIIKNDKFDYDVKTNEILYFISTVDNYNIHDDLFLDINVNLNVLMKTLSSIDKNNKELVFNFVSSWFVYGKNTNVPFKENDL